MMMRLLLDAIILAAIVALSLNAIVTDRPLLAAVWAFAAGPWIDVIVSDVAKIRRGK